MWDISQISHKNDYEISVKTNYFNDFNDDNGDNDDNIHNVDNIDNAGRDNIYDNFPKKIQMQ